MKKSESTKLYILQKGMAFAATYGLYSISIGKIAAAANMSRTGVISHFANKEDMQVAILAFTEEEFKKQVVEPSIDKDALVHLNNFQQKWLQWLSFLEKCCPDQHTSCPLIKASIEFKADPNCLVRQFMQDQQARIINYLTKLAVNCQEQGYFSNDKEPSIFAYEFYGLYTGHVVQTSLINKPTLAHTYEKVVSGLITRYMCNTNRHKSLINLTN
ncbi:TetR/AcrR family transcriptional regulator [Pseudoalteromonas carrageenovora]|uniref:TetR/AcrR family transcriptional regulator n=1 Tax=Pseudoalteromonas carrageenovora TaxID=227 RepID=UPI002FD076F8